MLIVSAPSLFLSFSNPTPRTRSKMEEKLLTWRTESPSRKEFFCVTQQIVIEREVWGDEGSSNLGQKEGAVL